jgi:tRNA threonylcarbamoyl adenosine modification protein (Sua5/YciO/YrdC/YwlC family)
MQVFKSPLSDSELESISDSLKSGAIILMPTDTVYGLAASLDCLDAVSKIIQLKQRDASKPIPLLAASIADIVENGIIFPEYARAVARKFWPGPLTLVLDTLRGPTAGVRIPDSPIARAICSAAGGILRCTSANKSDNLPALDAESAANALPQADILIDGGYTSGEIPSTVARVSEKEITILRPGPISLADIVSCFDVLPEKGIAKAAIISASEMRVERDKLRSAGKKLVFTNGCFDILHAGHVSYLKFAREQGDALCVGLNSDASVRRNKGDTRPIIDEMNRAELLASLRFVDYVVFFDDDEPKNIIAEILPDILVKGKDWAHYVSGADIVEANGGKVVLADMVEGLSTTNIIEKILKN